MNANTTANDSSTEEIEQAAANVSVDGGPAPNPEAVVRDMAHDIQVAAEAGGSLREAVVDIVGASVYVDEEDEAAMVDAMVSVVGA